MSWRPMTARFIGFEEKSREGDGRIGAISEERASLVRRRTRLEESVQPLVPRPDDAHHSKLSPLSPRTGSKFWHRRSWLFRSNSSNDSTSPI